MKKFIIFLLMLLLIFTLYVISNVIIIKYESETKENMNKYCETEYKESIEEEIEKKPSKEEIEFLTTLEEEINITKENNNYILSGTIKKQKVNSNFKTTSYIKLKITKNEVLNEETIKNTTLKFNNTGNTYTYNDNFIKTDETNTYFYILQEFTYGKIVTFTINWGNNTEETYTVTFNIKTE